MSLTTFHLTYFHRPRLGPLRGGSLAHRLRRRIAEAPLTSPVLYCLPATPRTRTPLHMHWEPGTDGCPRLEARWHTDD